jgi:DNA mismatch repair ATPase MutS
MRDEDKEYIRKCVYPNIALANYGRVSLSQVYRLFSDYGSLEEVEKCLDSFVKEGVAEKLNEGGAKIYVFKEIAAKFERKWKEQLENLETQKNIILREKQKKENEVKVLNELYNLWRKGWKSNKEQSLELGIKNYISSFWESSIKECVKAIKELEGRLALLESDIRKTKKLIEEGA